MRATVAAVLGVVASVPALADPAADGRFAAFLEACLDGHRDPVRRAAAIGAAGWTAAADDADAELAAVMRASRRAIAEAAQDDGMTGSVSVFARDRTEGPLYLVTTEVNMPEDAEWKIDLLGCHLYDFAATAPIDPAEISARFDEAPAETADRPGILTGQTWNVEKIEGVWDVQNTFIPEGSPAAARAGFAGVMLKITSTRE
jgi:hypothetical protein